MRGVNSALVSIGNKEEIESMRQGFRPTLNSNGEQRAYIIILNWNSWQHTIECLESVARLTYSNFQVVVCDNASSDGSIDYIKSWANGEQEILPNTNPTIRTLIEPLVRKPITFVEYSREEAEHGGTVEEKNVQLVIIHTGGNLGFAGGSNIGLRYALTCGDMEYVWLLNNDTVVCKDALTALVERMQMVPDAGICGSTLLYYDKPNCIQTMGGGRYNRWLGMAKDIGRYEEYTEDITNQLVSLEYVCGASMLVSKPFLEETGLMSEDYFLYFEELDWALRGRPRFTVTYAPKSIVYHKEGATLGTSSKASSRSDLSDFYMLRNRFQITRKYYPHASATLYLWIPAMILNRIVRGQWRRALLVLKIAICRDFKTLDKRYGVQRYQK